jgi:hypothetical protein
MSPAVVVKGTKLSIRLWDSTNAPTPSVGAFRVFVNEITEMDDKVDALLAGRISESIEEAKVQV